MESLREKGKGAVAEKMLKRFKEIADAAKDAGAVEIGGEKLVKKIRGPILCLVGPPGVGKTSLGNLNERSLADILRSPELEEIVKGFHRGRLVHPHCRRCLGSTSRLGSWLKPPLSLLGLRILKPFFYRHYRLFEE